jgi:drug/metabolite transporter (DMT)-like permease
MLRSLGLSGMSIGTKSRIALGVAMASASFSAVLNKFALNAGLHPLWLNALRLGFTLMLMLIFALVRRCARGPKDREDAPQLRPSRREAALSVASGGFLAAHLACWVYALKLTDALAATTIWSTYLFFAALGSVWLLKERIPRAGYAAMALALVGVAVCNLGWNGARASGNLWALGAAVTQAAYFLCGRTVRRKADTFSYTLTVYLTAFVLLVLAALALRLPFGGVSGTSLASTFALAVVSTLMGHTLCSYALKGLSATTVSTGMLTEVVGGPLVVFLLLGEAPGAFTLIGGAVIAAAVVWYFWIERRASKG